MPSGSPPEIAGSPNNCCKDLSRIFALEMIKLGLTEPGTLPFISIKSVALMATLPTALEFATEQVELYHVR